MQQIFATMIWGIALLGLVGLSIQGTLPFLLAKEIVEAPKKSACESFGVQKFQVKKEAPSFSLKNLDGKEVTLKEFSGKSLLLFFWATWCPACKEEFPLLEKFFEKQRGRFEMLTVAIDGEKEKRVKNIVKEQRITLPVLLDRKEAVARTYGVRMIPTAFFINGEGVILGMIVGQRDWCSTDAQAAIEELLNLR